MVVADEAAGRRYLRVLCTRVGSSGGLISFLRHILDTLKVGSWTTFDNAVRICEEALGWDLSVRARYDLT